MQFTVIGRDGTDPNAMLRRRAARAEHLALGERMQQAGTLLCAVALLDEFGQMNGSVLLVSFSSRSELEEWLHIEPYMVGGVWENVQIQAAQLGPGFAHLAS